MTKRMIIFAGTGVLVLVISNMVVSQFPSRDDGPDCPQERPAILIEPPFIDFGDVVQGDATAAVVRVGNVSGRELSLDIQKSCGCTSAELGKATLLPNESTTLRVTMDTASKNGPFHEVVFVSTGEHADDNVIVPVYGQARWVINVAPDKVLFGEVRHRKDAVRQIILRPLNGQLLAIESVSALTPALTVELVNACETQAVVAVSLRTDAKPGKVHDFVEIVLRSPLERTVKVPVSGYYTGELSAQPPQLSWDQLTDENWRDMLLQAKIEQVDGKSFAIKTASSSDGRLTTVTEPIGATSPGSRADAFLLTVTLTSNVSEIAEAVVVIEGDFSQDAVLEIPIHVSRRK